MRDLGVSPLVRLDQRIGLQAKKTDKAALARTSRAGARRVLESGIYLAQIHDGQFEIKVPDGFQPRAF